MIFYVILIVPVLIAAIIALFLIYRANKKRKLIQTMEMKLLSINLPKKQKSDSFQAGQPNDWKEEINLSAQLFSILVSLKSHFVLEAAVHNVGEEIHFYIGVPTKSVEAVIRQIQGLWKDAQVSYVDDYNIFNSSGESSGVFVRQKFSYALPVRTYIESNTDTFAPILSGLSKISEVGEGIAIQVLGNPAPESAKKNILQMLESLKKGAKMEDLIKGLKINFGDIKKAMSGPEEKKENEPKIVDEDAIKALESKISKPLLALNIRVVASALNNIQADMILDGVLNGFSQFSSPRRQEFKIVKPRNIKDFFYNFSFRDFDENQNVVLNTEELASVFHLPTATSDIPKIKWAKAKEAPPPVLPDSGTLVGESDFRNEHKPVYITEEDRRRHVYLIGQTGTGKTNLLMNMAIEDIKQGKGVCVIDPHGEDAESVLSAIPKDRLDDVIVFDPADLQKPMGMNMLEYDFNKPEEKTFIVNELFNIFEKLYDMKVAGGPMFEQYTKNAILLLMEDMVNEPATLMEIQRVFTDDDYRERKLMRIANPVVIDFWEKEAQKATGEHSLANMSAYITSKFNNFTVNDYVRPIIGQEKSAFNFRKIMDEGKILILPLSKGKIGEANANLLGMIILGKILMAALSRADMPQENRRDFNLFIDEFQNFTTDSTSIILAEARKYRLNLVMAHQFIAQLPDKIKDSVFGNVGTKIVFRVGISDAEFLVKEFTPVFDQTDLTTIATGRAYIKMLIHGASASPFSIKTFLKPKADYDTIATVKEISRLKYGTDRQEVEQKIISRLRS